MSFITGLFKSPFEKFFNISNLKFDQNPINTPRDSAIVHKFVGTYNDQPAQILFFYPNEKTKATILCKAPGFAPVQAFKQGEFTAFNISGTFLIVLQPLVQPLPLQFKYFEALKCLKVSTDIIDMLYSTLNVQIKDFSEFFIGRYQSQFVFQGYSQLSDNGLDIKQAVGAMTTHFKPLFKPALKIEVKQVSVNKYRSLEPLCSPIFQVLDDMQNLSRMTDQLFLKQILDVCADMDAESIVGSILMQFVQNCQATPQIVGTVYEYMIRILNIVLESGIPILRPFDEVFAFLCKTLQSDVKIYIKAFVQIQNHKNIPEPCLRGLAEIISYFLSKSVMNSPLPNAIEINKYFTSVLKDNTINIFRVLNKQQTEGLLKSIITQIQTTGSIPQSLLSWNSYLIISQLIQFNIEFKTKCKNYDSFDKSVFVGLESQTILHSQAQVYQMCLQSIQNANYDFIQAVYLLKMLSGDLNITEVLQGIAALNSQRALFVGRFGNNDKQKQLVVEVLEILHNRGDLLIDAYWEGKEQKQQVKTNSGSQSRIQQATKQSGNVQGKAPTLSKGKSAESSDSEVFQPKSKQQKGVALEDSSEDAPKVTKRQRWSDDDDDWGNDTKPGKAGQKQEELSDDGIQTKKTKQTVKQQQNESDDDDWGAAGKVNVPKKQTEQLKQQKVPTVSSAKKWDDDYAASNQPKKSEKEANSAKQVTKITGKAAKSWDEDSEEAPKAKETPKKQSAKAESKGMWDSGEEEVVSKPPQPKEVKKTLGGKKAGAAAKKTTWSDSD